MRRRYFCIGNPHSVVARLTKSAEAISVGDSRLRFGTGSAIPEIATPRQVGARNDKRERAQNDRRERTRNDNGVEILFPLQPL